MLKPPKVQWSVLRFSPWCGALAYVAWAFIAHAQPVTRSKIALTSFQSHGRLSFEMDEGVKPIWKSSKKGFELVLPGLEWADLGLEGGASSLRMSFQDARIKDVVLSQQPGRLVLKGVWNFPRGAAELAFPVMESFDYRQQNPPRFVIDFWYKKGPTLKAYRVQQEQAHRERSIQRAIAASKNRKYQRRVLTQRVESTGDPLKFCREPFTETTDVLIPFRPTIRGGEVARWIPTRDPDQDYPYFISPEDGLEHETVRLAHELVKTSKPALALKTIEFYLRDFSKAPHAAQMVPEMLFLKANILLKLQMRAQGEQILAALMLDHRKHPVALHAGLYMASNTFQRGEPLAALEHFLWLIQHHGQHELAWTFHLGAGESLFDLRQTERASREYQWVLESRAPEDVRILVSQRLGDLLMERQQYEQALAAYFRSTRAFPKGATVYPELALNRGETLLALGQFDRARNEFERFVSLNPSFPAAWRATFRLGELAARKGNREEANTWYRRTINDHPGSGGAVLAQLRLIACGDHGGLNLASANHFFENDAETFVSTPEKSREVFVESYGDLVTLTKLRTWLAFEDYRRVLDFVLQNLDRTKPAVVRDRLAEAYRVAFRQQALRYLSSQQPFEAIAFYQDYGTKIPVAEKSDVELSDVFLRMAKVATSMEMGSLAEKLLALVHPGRVPASDAEHGVAEAHYLKAKALWIKENGKASAVALSVRDELKHIIDESPYSGEREWMLGALEEQQGNLPQAIHHLSKASLLLSRDRLSKEEYWQIQLRFQVWLADLHARAGGRSTARDLLRTVAMDMMAPGRDRKPAAFSLNQNWSYLPLPTLHSVEEVLLREAEWFEQDGLWKEASDRYKTALDQGFGSNKNLYLRARALSRVDAMQFRGEIEEKLKAILASKSDDFWKKLAQEALANNQVQGGTL